MNVMEFNRELAKALSLPPNTRRAVVTIEVGMMPTIDVETVVVSRGKRLEIVDDPNPAAIATLPFMLRLRMEPLE